MIRCKRTVGRERGNVTGQAGEEVTVLIQPAKSGQTVGMIRNVVMADGTKLQ